MANYHDIKYNVDYGGNAGSLFLLSTFTSDGSDATASFTSSIDSTYKEYLFIFTNIHPESNDISFSFQANASGGSGYNETITSTSFFSYHREDDVYGLSYATGGDQAQGTSFQNISDSIGNANDEAVSGWLRIFHPSDTTFVKHFISCAIANMHSEGAYQTFRAGYINTTSAIDEVQFKFSSGEIQGGKIQMFGVL
tara:strand:- start:1918 stop:2505 length:588 start_codon:yes stop_codon:yes gene_type:complete